MKLFKSKMTGKSVSLPDNHNDYKSFHNLELSGLKKNVFSHTCK